MKGIAQIEPGLYQGALACVLAQWTDIQDKVDTVILLAGGLSGGIGTIPQELGMSYYDFPILDDANGLPSDVFWQLFGFCGALAHKKVLVVCHMGENRSGLAACMILIHRGHLPTEAVQLVHTKGNHLSKTQPHSFWNPGFNKQILTIK